ncbi:hypothetical protein IAR55_005891 [Kwoniella newhampshirensis]|uniref:DUF1996 domain-containing protein n=1 Tax=Kwoniella newhampshirensis TaxID=1651941 RepID=A0AAW0YVM3_9TREE
MMSMRTRLIIIASLLATPYTTAYDDLLFTEDFFPLINTRLDPIISPGKVSSHVHHVVGSSAFTATEDFATAQAGSCTTANLAQDKSSYWAPLLFYKWRNGSYSAIVGDGASAYWKMPLTNPTDDDFLVVPDDFRVVAGDITRTTYNSSNALDNAVSFQCIDAGGSYDKTPYIPSNRECLTLRPQINFPECWDGVNAYKEDGSHVYYPIDGNPEGGKCPEGYHKIPHLFLETTYHIKEENIGEGYEWYPGCFVLANGDDFGYTFHADWINGFPHGFIVDTFHQCYDGTSISKTCAPIDQGRNEAYNNGIDSGSCVTQGQIVNERVGQLWAIPELPGNNLFFNSSRTPAPKASGYQEKAEFVQVTNSTGGYCVSGTCIDYIGSDVVTSYGASGTNPLSSEKKVDNGAEPSANQTVGSASGISASATSSTPANTTDTAGSITEAASIATPSVPTSGNTQIGINALAPEPTVEDDDDEELVCHRRKKRRVPAWQTMTRCHHLICLLYELEVLASDFSSYHAYALPSWSQ